MTLVLLAMHRLDVKMLTPICCYHVKSVCIKVDEGSHAPKGGWKGGQ